MADWNEWVARLNTHDWTPSPDRTALLFLDLQEYFRGLVEPLLPALERTVAAARRAKIPVIFTRHRHPTDEDTGMLGRWWSDLIHEGTNESQLLPELPRRTEDPVVDKNRYSAFFNTDLEARLRIRGITDLVIGGVMTNLCCETTARDAFVRDFRIFVLADATATADEELQIASLRNLAFGFAVLMTADSFAASLRGKRRGVSR